MKQPKPLSGKGNAYRIFFAAAALQAIISPLLLLFFRYGLLEPPRLLTLGLWHAQEMIFGYVLLVIAGYLVTQISPARLFGLLLLWLMGRLIWLMDAGLPAAMVALVAAAFPLALSWLVSTKFKAAKRLRNQMFSIIFWCLGSLATIFYALIYIQNFVAAYQMIYILIYLVTLFIIIMGGRLIPPATIGALREQGKDVRIPFQPTYETICMALALLLMLFELLPIAPFWQAIPALALSVVLLLRLSLWRSLEIRHALTLWPLHLGYFWLAAGFALLACARLDIVLSSQDALHAITLGGIGVITLTMLIRVSGIRGTQDQVNQAVLWGIQSALFIALAFRLAAYSAQAYSEYLLWLSAISWALAFTLFLYSFYPACQLIPHSAGRKTTKPKE